MLIIINGTFRTKSNIYNRAFFFKIAAFSRSKYAYGTKYSRADQIKFCNKSFTDIYHSLQFTKPTDRPKILQRSHY